MKFHAQAFKAAEAAECAGEQGKFWEMHNKIFETQKTLSPEDLSKDAETVGVDMPKFKACLDSGKYAEKIKKHMAEGQKAGVTGTPATLLGWMEPDGKNIKAVKILTGAQPYKVFKEAIEELLTSKK